LIGEPDSGAASFPRRRESRKLDTGFRRYDKYEIKMEFRRPVQPELQLLPDGRERNGYPMMMKMMSSYHHPNPQHGYHYFLNPAW